LDPWSRLLQIAGQSPQCLLRPVIIGVSRCQARDPRRCKVPSFASGGCQPSTHWRALTVHIPSHPHSRKAPAQPPTRDTHRSRLGGFATPQRPSSDSSAAMLPPSPGLNRTEPGEECIHRWPAMVAHGITQTIGVCAEGGSTDVADPHHRWPRTHPARLVQKLKRRSCEMTGATRPRLERVRPHPHARRSQGSATPRHWSFSRSRLRPTKNRAASPPVTTR
jgi:hypothetical protein